MSDVIARVVSAIEALAAGDTVTATAVLHDLEDELTGVLRCVQCAQYLPVGGRPQDPADPILCDRCLRGYACFPMFEEAA